MLEPALLDDTAAHHHSEFEPPREHPPGASNMKNLGLAFYVAFLAWIGLADAHPGSDFLETKSLVARDDGAHTWTLNTNTMATAGSCSYFFDIYDGDDSKPVECRISLLAESDDVDPQFQPWSDVKCKVSVPSTATPEQLAYVTAGTFDGNSVTITLSNEVTGLVADFTYASASALQKNFWYPKEWKVTSETRPIDAPKTKRLVAGGDTKSPAVRRSDDAHTWTVHARTMCLGGRFICLYHLTIHDGEDSTSCFVNIDDAPYPGADRHPWSGLACEMPLPEKASPEDNAWMTDGQFNSDASILTITLANELKGLVADLEFSPGEMRGYYGPGFVPHGGADATAETRPLEAPKTKRLLISGKESKRLARLRRREEATSEHQTWYLSGGVFRNCEGNTCEYQTWIFRPNDVGEGTQKRCTFNVTATGDNAAIDEPFNAVRCSEPDAQEYLVWGAGPVLDGEAASGLVLKIFLADEVEGWIAVFAVYPDAMYTGRNYSDNPPSGTAIPWGGDTSNIPPTEGVVTAEGETPPEGAPDSSTAKRAAKRGSEAENKPEWRLHDVWRGKFP